MSSLARGIGVTGPWSAPLQRSGYRSERAASCLTTRFMVRTRPGLGGFCCGGFHDLAFDVDRVAGEVGA